MCHFRRGLSMRLGLVTLIISGVASVPLYAQGTAFTYQGQLEQNGAPVSGLSDLSFSLYDSVTGGTRMAGPYSELNVSVTNGLFTTTVDFGAEPVVTSDRWLEVQVRYPAGSGSYTILTPRQKVTPALYSLYAAAPWVTTPSAGLYYNGGNVGIGTTAPGEKLEIDNGNLYLNGDNRGLVVDVNAKRVGLMKYSNHEGGIWRSSGQDFEIGRVNTSDITTGTPTNLDLYVAGNGNVGIGTGTPGFPLTFPSLLGDKISLWGQSGNHYGFGVQAGTLQIHTDQASSDIVFGYGTSAAFTEGVRITGDGLVGIGTSTPRYPIDARTTLGTAVWGEQTGDGYGVVGYSDAGGIGVYGNNTGASTYGVGVWAQSSASTLNGPALRVNNSNTAGIGIWSTTSSSDGNIIVTNGGGGPLIRGFNGGCCPVFEVQNSGHTVVSVLEITGGSDVAEPFNVNDDPAEPGMVLAIDPDHAGQLRLACEAYDTRVAGIVSGAGGVATGLSMGHTGTLAAGKYNVALSGRVYCWCDASNGPIHAGDFLTTSDTPGHAMAASDHARAQGAIIGKAMTSLESGRGLVLTLVSLQ